MQNSIDIKTITTMQTTNTKTHVKNADVMVSPTTPAYKGARFNIEGKCIAHSDVRLCRVTSDGGFKIVRKSCYKCGRPQFMADKSKKIRCHGYNKKKCYKPRTHDIPGDIVSAGDPCRSAKQRRAEVLKKLPSTGSSKRPTQSSANTKKKGESSSNFRRSLTKNDEPTHQPKSSRRSTPTRRRARTLSPKRTTDKESSALNKYRNLHSSLAMPKGYGIKELMDDAEPRDIIKHPQRKYSNPLTKSPSSENLSCNALSNTTPKKDNTKKERKRRVSKELGYCSVHPNVQLTVVRTVSKSSKGSGSFNIVKESCPICAASALDLVAPDTTKVLKCKEVDITLDPVAPDTTKVLKPKCKEVDFSSSAPMVIYKPKRSYVKKSSDAEVDMKEGEDQDDRRNLQNSTTRLMRRRSSDGKNVKERTSGNTMKKVKALDYFRA